MKCVICKNGETQAGTTTVTLQRGESTIVVKGVAADICANCGEYYLSEQVSKKIYSLAEEAVQKGAEVEIVRFAA